jgi:uncharacterized phage protein (TIGR01671 family)
MRELKFRSWKMHYGKLRRCIFSPFGLIEYAQRHPEAPVLHNEDVNDIRDFMPNADVIEQYTGLKDKHGKEIYEGDIVSEEFEYGGEKAKTIWQVRWCDDECAFELHYVSGFEVDDCWLVADDEENYKVIGNIHENPELIGEEE